MAIAEDLLEKGRYKEALEHYLKVPNDSLTNDNKFNMALCYAAMKDNKKAIDILIFIRREGYTSPFLDFTLGKLYEREADVSKALYFYRKGMQQKETFKQSKSAYDFLAQQKELDDDSDKIIEIKPIKSTITYKDVQGLEKVKKQLFAKIILPLKEPWRIREYGRDFNTGVMLYGSAGNGKTFLVSAIAGEANAYTITPKIYQIEGQYVGISQKNVHAIFEQARMNSPCVIFIDEFDVIGEKRSNLGGDDEHGGSSSLKSAVNTLLDEMDGAFQKNDGIMVLAGTNRPWDIDPALLREGRFGTTIYIPPPNKKEREASIRYNLSKKEKVSPDMDYGRLARASIGFSQADIKGACNNAAELAYLEKYETGKDVPISMGKMLIALKNYENSMDNWFMDAKKELLGTRQTSIVDGKKHVTLKSAKLDPLERIRYKSLIQDINKYAKSESRIKMRKLFRNISLFIK